MRRLALAFTTMALLLAACAADAPGTDPTDTDPGRPDPQTPDVTAPDNGGRNGEVPRQLLDDLLEQASQETGVSIDEISVVTAESVTWPDGSIGCPEPGMAYTQALVPGYRAVVDVAGEEMHFHAGTDGQFTICENPQPPTDES